MPRSQRLIRGWLLAFFATSSAALPHALAGGEAPAPMLFALCTALAGLVSVGLAGIRMPRLGLALTVAASQGIFHGLYGHAGGAVLADSGHTHHNGNQLTVQVAGAGHLHQHSDTKMLVLHLLAALVTYVLVRRADALAVGLRDLAQQPWQRLSGLFKLPVLSLKPQLSCLGWYRVIHQQWWFTSKGNRGPPFVMV